MARPVDLAADPLPVEVSISAPARQSALGLRRSIRIAGEYVIFYALLAMFGLSGLAWSLAATVLRLFLPAARSERIGQWLVMAGCRMYVALMRASGLLRCDLHEIDALRVGPAVIIAPNHPSLLDAILMLSRLSRVVCTAKPEIWDNPLLGSVVRLAGYIRNRAPSVLIRNGVRQVRSGRHFLIFPEGTRSKTFPVGNFKGGFALIAKKSGAAVQTVFIDTNSGFLGKGWPVYRKPEFPLVYRVRLGPRLAVNGDVHQAAQSLQQYYAQELVGTTR
jgi:1-acyl-sn-glycerol-3-phosphate acyltransferase